MTNRNKGKMTFSRVIKANPKQFYQTIVQTDGSTFTLRTVSPRSILKMTKDTRNHSLWNPSEDIVEEKSAEMLKFSRRFGELDLAGLSEAEQTTGKK